MPTFVGAAEVAEMIGLSTALFTRQRDWLQTHEDFPLPMPAPPGAMLRWRAAEVQAWVDRHGRPASATPAPLHPTPADLIEEAARP